MQVPDTAPLPDLVLDNIRYQRLGLDLSEVLLVVNSVLGAVVVFSHVHRLVILRRVWTLLGILYYYRCQDTNYFIIFSFFTLLTLVQSYHDVCDGATKARRVVCVCCEN